MGPSAVEGYSGGVNINWNRILTFGAIHDATQAHYYNYNGTIGFYRTTAGFKAFGFGSNVARPYNYDGSSPDFVVTNTWHQPLYFEMRMGANSASGTWSRFHWYCGSTQANTYGGVLANEDLKMTLCAPNTDWDNGESYLGLINGTILSFRYDHSESLHNGMKIKPISNSTLTTNCNFHIAGTQTWSDHITWDDGVQVQLGGSCLFIQGSGDTWGVWNSSIGADAWSIKCPFGARVEIGEMYNQNVGLYVYGNLEVRNALFVNDYARIDALRVGVTSTDPLDGNLYVEGDATIVDDLEVGDNLTVGDKLQVGVDGSGELLANNGCFGQNYGADAWGGNGIGIRNDTTTDVVFYAENRAATDGYGCSIRAGNGGSYILWMRDADATHRFKFYANGATSPSDISDERLKINISDFDGSALDNVKWLSNNLKTFNFKCDENDDTLLMPQNTYTGFVAQTLLTSEEDSIKRLVHTANETMESGDRYYLDYKGITAQLARAVQELSDKNDELSAKMEALEAQISGSN
jgi:hypothetical protein